MDRRRKAWLARAAILVMLALVGSLSAARGMAEERRERDGRGHEVQRWKHGDMRHFHERDLARWHGGRWFHGEHFGRMAWWWIVDGVWYYYPAPVYPYPDPYTPPAIIVQAPPPAPTQAPPALQYWYYCASSKAYYPYVSNCPEAWMQVVPQATPPGY
jgi:hypothetical protein